MEFVDGDLEILHEEICPALREVVEDIDLSTSEESREQAIAFTVAILKAYPQKISDIAEYLSQDEGIKTFFNQPSKEEIIAKLNKPVLKINNGGGVLTYCNQGFDDVHIIDLEFGGILDEFHYVSIDG